MYIFKQIFFCISTTKRRFQRLMDIAKTRKKREKLEIYITRLTRVSLSVEAIALSVLAPWREKLSLFRTQNKRSPTFQCSFTSSMWKKLTQKLLEFSSDCNVLVTNISRNHRPEHLHFLSDVYFSQLYMLYGYKRNPRCHGETPTSQGIMFRGIYNHICMRLLTIGDNRLFVTIHHIKL